MDVLREEDSTDMETDDVYVTSAFSIKNDEPEHNVGVVKVENDGYLLSEEDPLGMKTHDVYMSSTFSVKEAEPEEVVPGSETCLTSPHDGSQGISIKVENVTDIEEERDPLEITFPEVKDEHEQNIDIIKVENDVDVLNEDPIGMKTDYVYVSSGLSVKKAESENCIDLQNVVPGSETYLTSHDGSQGIDIKVEDVACMQEEQDPLAITSSVIKDEHERSLNEHQHIDGEERPCSSDVRDKTNSRKSDVIKNHDGKQSYSCDMCKKLFSSQSILKRHKFIHTGKRPYACDVCSKSFNRLSNLKKHQLLHTGERPYTCNVCNNAFSHRNYLIVHLRTHNGERPYFCDTCNKSFSSQNNLKKHKRIHTGERPYGCDVCSKSFALRSDLKKHQHIHSGMQPYSCDVCNRSFSRQSYLKKHQRIHTR